MHPCRKLTFEQGASIRETGCEQGQGAMFGGLVDAAGTLALCAQERASIRKAG